MRRNRYSHLAPVTLARKALLQPAALKPVVLAFALACSGAVALAPLAFAEGAPAAAAAPATTAPAPAAAAAPAGPTPPEVQQAVDYTMPENPCHVPKMERGNSSGAFERFEHQVKMYQKCVPEYQQTLTTDFQMLQAGAKKGPTKEQEAIIVGKAQKILVTLQSLRGAAAAAAPAAH